MYVSVWIRYYLYDYIDGHCYWTKWQLVKKRKEYESATEWIEREKKNTQGRAQWGVSFWYDKEIVVR